MSKKDYYKILGVNKDSTPEEIKKAYRKLAMQHHPDKNQGNKKAEERFKDITEAYDVLGDPEKKQSYDNFTSSPFGPGRGYEFKDFNFGKGGFGQKGPRKNQNEDSFDDVFGDLFSDFFRSDGDTVKRRPGFGGRQKGADLRYTLQISLEEAAKGCEKTISFVRLRNGQENTAKLSVNIPKGVKHEQKLKLAAEGDGGINGGANGDLFVIIKLMEHSLFRREEDDVHLELPISFVDAILGTNSEIPTLTGKAMLNIPAGTYSGQIFRLKGKGFPKITGFGSGDMLVKIIIDVPKKMQIDHRRFIEEMRSTIDDPPTVKAFKEKFEQLSRV